MDAGDLIKLDQPLAELLDAYCRGNGVDEQTVVALALRRFLTDDDPALAALIAGYVKIGALNAQIANEFTVCESEALTESW